MKTMSKNPLIIYYSYTNEHMDSQRQMLFDFKPVSLMADLKKNRVINDLPMSTQEKVGSNGYHFCSALHEMVDHSYILKSPVDVDLYLDETGSIIRNFGKNDSFFLNRQGSFKGCYSVDFSFSLIMFCEESVNVSLTPPYFHKTNQPNYGYLASGKFDISSWFRPIPIILNLWENSSRVYFQKDEAIGYLHFDTNRPIIFKQFEMTNNISKIVHTIGIHKQIAPFETLSKLYYRFRSSGLRDVLTKEIKKNII